MVAAAATATATLQVKDITGWMTKDNHAARATHFLVQSLTWSANRRREIFIFKDLTTA